MKWLFFGCLLFLILLPLDSDCSLVWAGASPEDREKLCTWVITHPLKGLQNYKEYICDGRLAQVDIGQQGHIHLRGMYNIGTLDRNSFGVRLMYEVHFNPYQNKEKK